MLIFECFNETFFFLIWIWIEKESSEEGENAQEREIQKTENLWILAHVFYSIKGNYNKYTFNCFATWASSYFPIWILRTVSLITIIKIYYVKWLVLLVNSSKNKSNCPKVTCKFKDKILKTKHISIHLKWHQSQVI